MTNLHRLDEQRLVATISSLKNAIGEMESLLNMSGIQNYRILDIINRFLTNSAELNEKIKTGELKEVDLAALRTSKKLVTTLGAPFELRTHSRKLVEAIKNVISEENQGSASTSGDNLDEIVLLVSILLLTLNIQN